MATRLTIVLLSVSACACGRIGYDEVTELHGNSGALHESGGTATSDDGGTATDAAGGGAGGTSSNGGSSGSGATSGRAGVANGGTSGAGGAGANGGTAGYGGSPGSGGASGADAAGSGGSTGNGGTPGSGGASGPDAAAGGRGATGTGGSGTGGTFVGDAGIVGCADGQREGFLDTTAYPNIAACDGGFQVAGVVGLTGPACGRAAGDDGALPDGAGCNAEDLCSAGFHLCASAAEVGAKSSTGCTGAVAGNGSVFYLTEQSGGGQQKCGPGTNDVFGCGNIGYRPSTGCTPLDRGSGDLCSALGAPWSCGSDLTAEALNVSKPSPTGGGVLCCRD